MACPVHAQKFQSPAACRHTCTSAFSCATDPATALIIKVVHLAELDLRLMLHDPELADTIVCEDGRFSQGNSGEVPLVVVTTIALVNQSHAVCLNDPKVFEGRTARNHMGFITGRELHCDT